MNENLIDNDSQMGVLDLDLMTLMPGTSSKWYPLNSAAAGGGPCGEIEVTVDMPWDHSPKPAVMTKSHLSSQSIGQRPAPAASIPISQPVVHEHPASGARVVFGTKALDDPSAEAHATKPAGLSEPDEAEKLPRGSSATDDGRATTLVENAGTDADQESPAQGMAKQVAAENAEEQSPADSQTSPDRPGRVDERILGDPQVPDTAQTSAAATVPGVAKNHVTPTESVEEKTAKKKKLLKK